MGVLEINGLGGEGETIPDVDGYVDMHEWMREMADQFGDPGAVAYFIGGDEGPIKIGWSGRPKKRLCELRREHSRPDLRILATRDGGSFRESAYHNQFYRHCVGGEWFTRCPEVESEIARLGGEA